MHKLIAEEKLKDDKRSRIVVGCLVVIVAFLLVGQVVIANRLVEVSAKLRNLDKQIDDQQNTNQQLSEELRVKGSIQTIEDQATALGFSRVNRYSYLPSQPPVALNSSFLQSVQTQ